MPTNFWSFAYGIIKGSWAKVRSDISTSLEMTGLQSWGIEFFLFLCCEVKEKINASTMKTCHFKASEDITTYFGSETLNDTISKRPKVGRNDWPPCMISDNFEKAILLHVYYMGGIDLWVRVYEFNKYDVFSEHNSNCTNSSPQDLYTLTFLVSILLTTNIKFLRKAALTAADHRDSQHSFL